MTLLAEINFKSGYGQNKEQHSVTSDLNVTETGYFKCLIPDKFDSSFQLEVTFDDNSNNKNGQASTTHNFYKSNVQTKELITIKSSVNDRKLKPGETVQVEVKTNYDAKLVFATVAKNEIISTQSVTVAKDSSTTVDVKVEFEMVPEVKFVAYENRGEHWNADTLTFFVQEDFEHEVNIVPSKDQTKVGEKVDLEISSNSPKSEVFLLGVDKSVKLLAQEQSSFIFTFC